MIHITFVIPTFNRGYIIQNVLDSIFVQTYPEWDIVIVDDGSTDDTFDIVKRYDASRITFVRQENKGPSAARNKAFDYVRGDWVSYIDSDNEVLPQYLAVMVDWITKNPNALYALPRGNRTLELFIDDEMVEHIDDSTDFPERLSVEDICVRNLHFDINGFMHSRISIDAGIRFEESMRSLEDWDFVLQIIKKYPDNFLYVTEVLFNYHQRFGTDGIVSNATYATWRDSFELIYQRHKDDPLMKNQHWYPDRVLKYKKLEEEFQAGTAPPLYLRYFKYRPS
jgi:glycosyltransferase involved in cell wall biosynthesis